MSRDIKFRAWEPEYKHMTYDLAFEDYEPINDLLASVDYLMQYTGITDRHGKEIYEGDLVKRYGGGLLGNPNEVLFIGEITFTQNGWKAKYNKMEGTVNPLPETAYGNIFNQDELMVVGNIYENDIDSIPEGLLE